MMLAFNHDHAILNALEMIIANNIRILANDTHLSLLSLRTLFLACISHDLVRNENTCTKRDICYSLRSLFPSVPTVQRTISSLCRELGIEANDLGIVAAPKGLVSGPLTYTGEQNEIVVVNHFGPSGVLIPVRPERLRDVSTTAKAILVVEKETVYGVLVNDPNFSRFCAENVLVVCGKGYPDHSTRKLLGILTQAYNLPTLVLTDGDPHGASIAQCYGKTLLNIQWIGVRPSQCGTVFSVMSNAQIPLTALERTVAKNLIAAAEQSDIQFQRIVALEMQTTLERGWKFELEGIRSVDENVNKMNPLFELLTRVLPTQLFTCSIQHELDENLLGQRGPYR